MDGQTNPQTRELLIERRFAAPPALIFKLWTSAEHLARWWGCVGSRMLDVSADPVVGGRYRAVMELADGSTHIMTGTYTDVLPPHRLAFTWAWEDEDGRTGHETHVTVDLIESGDGTQMTFRQSIFETTDIRDEHGVGWTDSFDNLDRYLVDRA